MNRMAVRIHGTLSNHGRSASPWIALRRFKHPLHDVWAYIVARVKHRGISTISDVLAQFSRDDRPTASSLCGSLGLETGMGCVVSPEHTERRRRRMAPPVNTVYICGRWNRFVRSTPVQRLNLWIVPGHDIQLDDRLHSHNWLFVFIYSLQ